MAKKKECPYCGKPSVTGKHIYRCLKNPQNEAGMPSEEELIESVAELPEQTEKELFMVKLRARYAAQLRTMSPEQGEKFLRKAQGL